MSASDALEAIILNYGASNESDSLRRLDNFALIAALIALKASVIVVPMPTIITTLI